LQGPDDVHAAQALAYHMKRSAAPSRIKYGVESG
jgi:hypothetical protein